MRNTIKRNYRVDFTFGNNLRYKRYCKNFVQMTINGHAFTITFVPEFQDRSIPIPPFDINLRPLVEHLSPADKTKLKVYMDSKIIFAERNNMKDEVIRVNYNFNSDKGNHSGFNIVYCLDSKTYEWIRRDLRKHFLYVNNNSIHGDWVRDEILHIPSIAYIDNKLIEMQDILPDSVKTSLEFGGKV